MTVDASFRLLLLFLSGSSQGSHALENSSIVYHVSLWIYFYYTLSLKARTYGN